MDTSHADRPEITAAYTPTERPTAEGLKALLLSLRELNPDARLTLKMDTAGELLSFTLTLITYTAQGAPRVVYYTSIDRGAVVHYTGSLYTFEAHGAPHPMLEPAELLHITDETGRSARTLAALTHTTH